MEVSSATKKFRVQLVLRGEPVCRKEVNLRASRPKRGEFVQKGELPAIVAEDGKEKRRGSERRPLGHGIRSHPRLYKTLRAVTGTITHGNRLPTG